MDDEKDNYQEGAYAGADIDAIGAISSDTPIPETVLIDSDNDGVVDKWDTCPDTPKDSCVNKNGCHSDLLYTQEQMNQVINSMLDWDKDKDGKIGLIEAIYILQESAGVPIPNSRKIGEH